MTGDRTERSPGIELRGRDPGAEVWKDLLRRQNPTTYAATEYNAQPWAKVSPQGAEKLSQFLCRQLRLLDWRQVTGSWDNGQPGTRN